MVPDIGKVPFPVGITEGGIHTAQNVGKQRSVPSPKTKGGREETVFSKPDEIRWHLKMPNFSVRVCSNSDC